MCNYCYIIIEQDNNVKLKCCNRAQLNMVVCGYACVGVRGSTPEL